MQLTKPRKKKPKFRSASDARAARELDASWQALTAKWAAESTISRPPKKLQKTPSPTLVDSSRSTAHIKSLDTGPAVAALPEQKKYTGSNMIGISQMAKSNAVPVFNFDHVVEIRHMRR